MQETLARLQAQLREVQANYQRLGADFAVQQEQLYRQVPCLGSKIHYRL